MDLRTQMALRLARLKAQFVGVVLDELEHEELLMPLREGAAQLERFLKQPHLGLNPRARLFEQIEALGGLGLPKAHVDALHELRKAANAGKHDPLAAKSVQDAVDILTNAEYAVTRIGVEGSAPGADSVIPGSPARRFAVLVSCYPTSGEVDYAIAALLEDGQVVELDSFQARFNDEERIVAALRQSGVLDQHPVDAATGAFNLLMRGSTEHAGVWVFTGTLRDLVAAMAPYQYSGALPSLQRQAHPSALLTALALALVDHAATECSQDELLDRLSDAYAVPATGPVEEMARRVATVAECADGQGVLVPRGPRVLTEQGYRLASAGVRCRDDSLGFAITADGTVLVNVGSPYVPMP